MTEALCRRIEHALEYAKRWSKMGFDDAMREARLVWLRSLSSALRRPRKTKARS